MEEEAGKARQRADDRELAEDPRKPLEEDNSDRPRRRTMTCSLVEHNLPLKPVFADGFEDQLFVWLPSRDDRSPDR